MSVFKNSTDNPVSHALIVDDDHAMRDSIEALLRSVGIPSKGFESAAAFLDEFRPGDAGCLLLDVRMPGMDGIELQKILKQRDIDIPVIILTAFANVRLAVRAMRNGAFDFIEKPFDDQQLIERVRQAFAVSAETEDRERTVAEARERFETLSEREREIMDMITEGYLNKQIAAKLSISQRTVENHRRRVMQKMNTKTVAELVRTIVTLESV